MAVDMDINGNYTILGNTDSSTDAAIIYVYTIKLFDLDSAYQLDVLPYEQDVYDVGKIELIAPVSINAYRLVTLNPVSYYDKDTLAHAGRQVGFSLQSVLMTQSFQAQFLGEIKQSGWGLTAGATYFAGNNGFITTTPPISGFCQSIGIAKDPNTLIINFQEPTIKN